MNAWYSRPQNHAHHVHIFLKYFSPQSFFTICTTLLLYLNRAQSHTHFHNDHLLLLLKPTMSDAVAINSPTLRVFLIPWFATGHIIPLVDIARLFASRGLRSTVVLTPANASLIRATVETSAASGLPLDTLLYPFPAAEVGLPPGVENGATVPHSEGYKLDLATPLARPAIESLIRLHRPDAIISDGHFPWTADLADELGIPCFCFHALGLFPVTIIGKLLEQKPHLSVSTDTEPFIVPDLPHPIRLVRSELPDFIRKQTEFKIDTVVNNPKTYGVVVNSYSAIETGYSDCYTRLSGERCFFVGPVALAKCGDEKDQAAAAVRGGAGGGNRDRCLSWLDTQPPGSVVYLCFGSWCHFSGEQIAELAMGLEKSGHAFLWVVRDEHVRLPEGFGERVQGRGLVVRGWVPQVAVLAHGSIGGFVTHCGWNSVLEGLSAGLPMVTWPLAIEQFINEKLVTDVLRVGVKNSEGFRSTLAEERVTVTAEEVAAAVKEVMGEGEEAEERRRRAREYGTKAREAVKEGGPSFEGVESVVEVIKGWAGKRVNGIEG